MLDMPNKVFSPYFDMGNSKPSLSLGNVQWKLGKQNKTVIYRLV